MCPPPATPRALPLIGITTYPRDHKSWFRLPAEYVDAVRRAGGLPLLLAPGETRTLEVLAALDGLLLSGGGDLDPALYGGAAHETIRDVDRERDRMELALARGALERGLPTFGICRGQQMLNVALGGSLIEDLPQAIGEHVRHRTADRQPTPHAVAVAAGSRLARLLGETDVVSPSWHHQAIRRLGQGLTVTARAPDGTIEAVELTGHRWCLAVQWHPELSAAADPAQQRLFDAFVLAAARSD